MAKKTGVELEFSILDDDFKKAIKEMNTSIASMRKELQLENEVLKSSNVSITDYQKKLDTLKNQQELAKNKVTETANAYEKAKEMFGENSKEATKYKDALIVAQTEHQRITNEIGKTTDAMKNYESQMSAAEKENKNVDSALSILTKTISEQKDNLDDLKKQYVSTVLEQGKSSDEAQKLKNDIKTLNGEISENEKKLNDAEKELGDFSNAEDEAGKHAITFGEMIKANLISDFIKSGIKELASGVKQIAGFFIDIGKQAFTSYGETQQLIGGVETLFGAKGAKSVEEYAELVGKSVDDVKDEFNTLMQSQNQVIANADNAYKTSGLSANKYMETVTSFSASLLQSLDGDTVKAAEIADMAIVDMSDNANKMGTDMSLIQNAYQGFAKQNYTMLDNLKLGYGGTKTEMQRLLADAEKITGIKYDINNLKDVYSAIHVIQGELGITGTTAKEASETLQGSISSFKSAWDNLIAGLGDPNADLDLLVNNLLESVTTVMDNALPIIETIINSMIQALPQIFEMGGQLLTSLIQGISNNIPMLSSVIITILTGVVNTILNNLPLILQAGINLIVELAKGIAQALPTLVPTIVSVILEMVNVLTNPDNLMAIIEAALVLISSLAEGIINAIPVLVEQLPQIIDNIVKFFTDNLDKIIDMGVEMIVNLTMALIDSIPVILENLPKIISAIISGLLKILPKLATAGLEMMVKLGAALIENIPKIVSKIPQIISSIVNGFADLGKKALDIGKNFVTGLWNGINNAKDWILGKIKGFKDAVIGGIKSFFGIHSPSTLFRDEIGKNLALGLGIGFTDEMKEVTSDMQDAIPTSFDVGVNTNSLTNGYSSNISDNSRTITDTSDYNPGEVAPIYLTIENFNNNREQDIEDLSEELAFYQTRVNYGKGAA